MTGAAGLNPASINRVDSDIRELTVHHTISRGPHGKGWRNLQSQDSDPSYMAFIDDRQLTECAAARGHQGSGQYLYHGDWHRHPRPAGGFQLGPVAGHAMYDISTEVGLAVGLGRTRMDSWGYCTGRRLWLLADVRPLPEPVSTVGHQSFWCWDGESR